MKLSFKNLSILTLLGVFLFSSLMCCCFVPEAKAIDEKPSCHQTTHNDQAPQKNTECDCEKSFANLEDANFLPNSFQQYGMNISTPQIMALTHKPFKVVAYKAPPQIYDTSPLYIKHSVLRI